MKKRFLYPTLLLGVLSLFSCQTANPSEGSSNGFSSEPSSSAETSESSEGPLALNEENLSSLFLRIIQTKRFVFGVKGGTPLTFTPDYLASQLNGVGYLALESFDSEKTNSERILYQCSFSVKGDVDVTTPLVKTDFYAGTTTPYVDFSEFDFMQSLGQSDVGADVFFKVDGEDVLYSTNVELIKALAKMCGFDSEAEDGTFYRAKFSINKNNALSFVLQGFDASYHLVDVETARGSFASIGKANIPCLEKITAKSPKKHYPKASFLILLFLRKAPSFPSTTKASPRWRMGVQARSQKKRLTGKKASMNAFWSMFQQARKRLPWLKKGTMASQATSG